LPDIFGGATEIGRELEEREQKKHRSNRAAHIAHDIDDAIRFRPQRFRCHIGHQSHGWRTIHHHEEDDKKHRDDHAGDAAIIESHGDKRNDDRRNQSANQDERHPFAQRRLGFIGDSSKNRKHDQSGDVIHGHDDANDILNVKNIRTIEIRIGGFQGIEIHVRIEGPVKELGQEGRASQIVNLPKQENAKEGKSDRERSLIVQLQGLFRLGGRAA